MGYKRNEISKQNHSNYLSNQELKKLRVLVNLQQEVIKEEVHSAMSPLSAISGYLEMMKMALDNKVSKEDLKRYRRKVENGVNELNEILERLHQRVNTGEEVLGQASFSKINKLAS